MHRPFLRTIAALSVVVLVVIAAAPAHAKFDSDPLAPARNGAVRCDNPNHARRTCTFMVSFTFDGDEITSRQHALVSVTPFVVMEIETPITLRGGAYCDPFREADVDAATFSVNAAPANAATAEFWRAEVMRRFGRYMGQETCVTIVPARGGLLEASVTLDGEPFPEQTSMMAWVRPEDGFRIGPELMVVAPER